MFCIWDDVNSPENLEGLSFIYWSKSFSLENSSFSITDILEIAFKNIGRENINIYSKVINKIRGTYRYFTNFNRIINSKILFKCSL